MEKSQNYVELWGTAGAAPSFSHENHGESFYRFPLRVERLSGQSDLPLILAPSALLEGIDIAEGTPLRVTGQLRSFNNRSGHGSRLVISTFAQSIEPCGRRALQPHPALGRAVQAADAAAHAAGAQHLRYDPGGQPPLRGARTICPASRGERSPPRSQKCRWATA